MKVSQLLKFVDSTTYIIITTDEAVAQDDMDNKILYDGFKEDICGNKQLKNLSVKHFAPANLGVILMEVSQKPTRKRYKKVCPFCGTECESFEGGNLLCKCNAKYYFFDKLWIDRNTGDKVWESEGAE